ncbi:hypothetical protein RND71_016712 [Anisodus tanguticus]|uniref:Uncharacterized protein n=1 Tax=Anisodus tanguticus TaxID=243964 RepID=A0AAE1S6P8_9SOLA|nr:hypothetical protein RND71_016712 [Anisodus tanguticus]
MPPSENFTFEAQLEDTKYGDTYDFYKQPACDHPSLKNHIFIQRHVITKEPQLKKNNVFKKILKVAIVSTLNDWKNKFRGPGMTTTLWKSYVKFQQHSGCRLKVQKGSDIILYKLVGEYV